jgi:hypothetical protein
MAPLFIAVGSSDASFHPLAEPAGVRVGQHVIFAHISVRKKINKKI